MLERVRLVTRAKAIIKKRGPTHIMQLDTDSSRPNLRTIQSSRTRRWNTKKMLHHMVEQGQITTEINPSNTPTRERNREMLTGNNRILAIRVGTDHIPCSKTGPENKPRAATIENSKEIIVSEEASSIKAKTLTLKMPKEKAGIKMTRDVWSEPTCLRWIVLCNNFSLEACYSRWSSSLPLEVAAEEISQNLNLHQCSIPTPNSTARYKTTWAASTQIQE